MRFVAPFLALAMLSAPAFAADLSGPARVTDGDTIRIGANRIRLWRVDAPERRQTCQGRAGDTTSAAGTRRPCCAS